MGFCIAQRLPCNQQIMEHQLKINPVHYTEVWHGRKRSELRLNDRPFKKDDTLILKCWDDKGGYYDVAPITCIITHILTMHQGLSSNYVLLSIVPLNNMS